uniref:Uncharacterized protein n=1 Tax=Lactuca sativa TaxID=4236 RepID=A0A9R1X9B2_LACSA|nr:hypothetical protein LSAT_V11C600332990 [Lactuca sativa]
MANVQSHLVHINKGIIGQMHKTNYDSFYYGWCTGQGQAGQDWKLYTFISILLKILYPSYLQSSSHDEQLLEAAWCLTNIAAGKPKETRA